MSPTCELKKLLAMVPRNRKSMGMRTIKVAR
jgi:hypothetical protein